jgi:pyruvate dehydrogenase E2 component (dihydrolipoamide acetyltransferase)
VDLSTWVVHALIQTLKEYPALNAHLAIDELCIYERIKLGLMVPTELGVMLACIEDAGATNLPALDAALHALYERARTGRFELSETRGATFMVADLSAYPVDAFTPILLPSAIAILGIGRTRPACRPTAAGCRPAHLLSLSLTFDHRGTDGIAAAHFLAAIVRRLEHPEG